MATYLHGVSAPWLEPLWTDDDAVEQEFIDSLPPEPDYEPEQEETFPPDWDFLGWCG